MNYYAMGDIHGRADLFWNAVEFMSHDAAPGKWHCYFLGDACDRGPDGWELIKILLDNPNLFTYLLGNHEDMLLKAIASLKSVARFHNLDITDYDAIRENTYSQNVALCDYNGGDPTMRAALKDPKLNEYILKLRQLPLTASHGVIDMCHAGCTIGDWERLKDVRNDEAIDVFCWDRAHFGAPWYENRILLHGHTPIVSSHFRLWKDYGPYKTGEKVNLDAGAVWTNELYLYDFQQQDVVVIHAIEN